jgi:hypothetical protein
MFDKKQFHHRHGIHHINWLRNWHLMFFWPQEVCYAWSTYSCSNHGRRNPARPKKAVDEKLLFLFARKHLPYTVQHTERYIKGLETNSP